MTAKKSSTFTYPCEVDVGLEAAVRSCGGSTVDRYLGELPAAFTAVVPAVDPGALTRRTRVVDARADVSAALAFVPPLNVFAVVTYDDGARCSGHSYPLSLEEPTD